MAKFILANDLFAKGRRFRKDRAGTEIPDDVVLPKGTRFMNGDYVYSAGERETPGFVGRAAGDFELQPPKKPEAKK